MANTRLKDESSRKQALDKKNLQDWIVKIRYFFFVPCHGFSKGLERLWLPELQGSFPKPASLTLEQ